MKKSTFPRQTVQSISPKRLAQLHAGYATSNLTENLAIDFSILARHTIPDCPQSVIESLEKAADQGIVKRMQIAAQLLYEAYGSEICQVLHTHQSDTLRGWACFITAIGDGTPLSKRLEQISPLADDPHFGVREWAWLAIRPDITADLTTAITLLQSWTHNPSERLRRFASESTRPRGVWCTHIGVLKASPALGLPILIPLRSDPSKYVQDSVANWLNDASKTQPEWVSLLCKTWLKESPTAETARICQRALRSINKKS